MSKWLILCLDGTWNTAPHDPVICQGVTNVLRFHDSICSTTGDGSEQLRYYESGVGTNWWQRLSGGGLGIGLDRHIKNAYRWLSTHYASGDKIAVLGFSRGAYAARSLVGLIRECWLLDRDLVARAARTDPRQVEYQRKYEDMLLSLSREAYSLYQTRDGTADNEESVEFRNKYGNQVQIAFLGVWDTVGAMGIPLWAFKKYLSPKKYGFHDTKLSGIVDRAYHAVAIDEHRADYAVSLWYNKPAHHTEQIVEQRWFIGSHADVGGGYGDNALSDITLRWMQYKATEVGIGTRIQEHGSREYMAEPHDSYSEFLGRFYSKIKDRYFRPFGTTVEERLDETFALRSAEIASYRPLNPGLEEITQRSLVIGGECALY